VTRGKYAARADTRLKALESEALREAHNRIKELEHQLGEAKHEIDTAKAQNHSQAMAAAQGLSAREKANLRNEIASLQYRSKQDRLRYALLMWEIMHRAHFGTPAPLVLAPADAGPDDPSYAYWLTVHWEIAALFCADYDEIWEFFESAQGYRWKIAGTDKLYGKSGQPVTKQTARESTRQFMKGNIKGAMMRRIHNMHDYYDRIVAARGHGAQEPVVHFQDAHPRDAADEDIRDNLVGKMKKKAHG